MTKNIQPAQGNTAYETIKTIFIAGLIALTVRSVAFEPFSIPSGSMIPSLLVGDYLFVSKSAYGYSRYSFPLGIFPIEGRWHAGEVKRGDVIVFRKPGNTNIDYIKRAIGLPGDRIQMKHGRLYINNKEVKRDYIGDYQAAMMPDDQVINFKRYRETLPNEKTHWIIERSDAGPLDDTEEFVVPEDHYFMMGDNRDGSQDSRVMTEVGYVPYENLIGRAERIFFSLDEGTRAWEVWKWPMAIRYSRLFQKIE
jgi:signal peptidase I